MLEPNEQRLADAASSVSLSLSLGGRHRVACAVMDLNGDIYSGIDVSTRVDAFASNGGRCAELAAVGAAAAAGAAPLITIVAMGDADRGVIPPCGRCRRILGDLHPDIYVIMPTESGPQSRPVRDLLPAGYSLPEGSDRPRIAYFHPRHYASIVAGRKTATVRYRDPLRAGPVALVFDDGNSIRHLEAVVEHVSHRLAGELTDDDAHREDLADSRALRVALTDHYPGLRDSDPIDFVTFRLVAPHGTEDA